MIQIKKLTGNDQFHRDGPMSNPKRTRDQEGLMQPAVSHFDTFALTQSSGSKISTLEHKSLMDNASTFAKPPPSTDVRVLESNVQEPLSSRRKVKFNKLGGLVAVRKWQKSEQQIGEQLKVFSCRITQSRLQHRHKR